MRVRPEQLQQQLQKSLQAVYLISGDENLLVQEACDAVRARCREDGVQEREILQAEGKFDWNSLLASSSEMSLFAERKLIELRLPSGKPGTEGSKALQAYLANLSPDNILLIVAGKIDKQSTNSKWFKALDQAGVVVQIWPVDARELPRWLQQRLRQYGLEIDSDALHMLCDRVEGNLLAASQEVEKLRLLSKGGKISAEQISGSVADNARYNLFSLLDHALLGETAQALKMMHGLQAEGTDATVILWGLAREIRLLYQCRLGLDQGQNTNQVLQAQRVWDKRKPGVSAALGRHNRDSLDSLLQAAAAADRFIKGLEKGRPWDQLSQLILDLAGQRKAA
jgi:DNA polymerase-3 subunit delta